MATAAMVFDIIARDGASPQLRRIGAEADGASRSFARLTTAAAGISAVVAGFAVKAAVDFEAAMTRIHTQAGVASDQIKGLGDALLKLSPKVGFNPEELATSLYHVESAGFRAKGQVIGIVEAASKLSKIGHADLETTTQAIVGTLASRIKGIRDATDAAAQLNVLVGTGDTTLQKVAQSIATGILPTAASLGLSFKDVGSALATLTDNVTPADEAATRLRTTLSLIEKPSHASYAALSSIGLSGVALAEDFRKPNGLLVALEDLKGHLDKTYPLGKSAKLTTDEIAASTRSYTTDLLQQGVSQKEAIALGKKYEQSLKDGGSAATLQAQTILQAFGGAKSGSTFLTLYNELDRLRSKYKEFGTSAQAAAKFQDAWAKQQETAKQKLDDLKASWDVFLVKMGNAILPDLKKVVDLLSKHPGYLQAAAVGIGALTAAWAGMKIASLIQLLGTLAGKIVAVGAASTAAAAETEAANLGGAVAGQAGGAAGSARGLRLTTLGKVVVPVAITYAVLKATGSDKFYEDAFKGQFSKALNDAPGYGKEFGAAFSRAFNGELSGTVDPQTLLRLLGGIGGATRAYDVSAVGKLYGKKVADQFAKGLAEGKLPQEAWADIAGPLNADPHLFAKNGRINGEAYAKAQDDAVSRYLKSQSNAVTKYLKALADAKNLQSSISLGGGVLESAAAGSGASGVRGAPIVGTPANSPRQAESAGTGILTAAQVKAAAVQKYLTSLKTKASEENANYATSLSVLNDKLTKNAALLSTGAVAGIDNTRAVKDAVSATDKHALAVYRQTGNLGQAKQAFRDGIGTIEDNMVALGFNRDTVEQLVTQLVGAKNNSRLQIEVIANGTFDLKDIFASGGIGGAAAGAAAALASGGLFRGRGTGTSDSNLVALSDHEFVVRASQTRKHLSLLHAINNGLPGFADGGLVGFNREFPASANRHVESLERAMNAMAQKWFQSRQTADVGQLGNVGGSGVSRWAPLVLRVLKMLGQPASFLPNVLRQIATESGGNPNITQGIADSNSAQGILAQGLMQVIPGTFAANAGPFRSLGPFNPLASLYAGLHHAIFDDPGGLNYLGQGHGYDSGGVLKPGVTQAINASGKPEAVLTNAQWRYIAAIAAGEKNQADVSKFLKAIAAATTKTADKLTSFAQAQSQYRDSLQGQLTTGNTFADIIGQSGNAKDLKTLLGGKLADLKAFALKVVRLKKAGWSDAIIRDISESGVGLGSQYADLLLSASGSDKATINRLSAGLTGGQLSTANLITQATGGTAGLTSASALAALDKAIYNKGANVPYWVNQAAQKQALMSVEHQHIHNGTDIETALKQAAFAQIAGSFT